MTNLELIALVGVALWLAVLSLVAVLLVRQLGLVTLRLRDLSGSFSLSNDGLMIGSSLPEVVNEHIDSREVTHILILSSTCAPCRDFADNVRGFEFPVRTVALVAGPSDVADSLVELLPSDIRVIRDPAATNISEALQISSAPFGLEVEGGVITGKTYLTAPSDLLALAAARSMSDVDELIPTEGVRIGA